MPKPKIRIIAVANQKGGVGKSTTAVSLGAALVELGKKVLVVDLDPQGNASTGLGIRHDAREVTVYDVLAAEAPIDRAIVPTPIRDLFAIPSTIDLAGAEIELVSQFSRELRLRKALEPLRGGDFDFILLDCPPSLGLLTVNALAAAEELIVPIQCEYYALEGLGQLLRNVRLVQQNVNQRLRLTGIVMTMFDPRTKLSEQVVAEVRRYFGDRVYDTIIPRTVRLSEAPGFGQPITVYDSRSRGAQSYRDLAREVAAKLPDDSPLPVIEDLPTVVVPPPEPVPARAPRPLVHAEEETEHAEVPEATEVAELAEVPEMTGEIGGSAGEPADDSEGDEGAKEVSDTDRGPEHTPLETSTSSIESAAPDVEGPSLGEPEEKHGPVPEPERDRVQPDEAPRPVRAESEEASPQVMPRPEVGRVVVIADPGQSGDDVAEAEPDVDVPAEATRRRRWRLFRRKGDR